MEIIDRINLCLANLGKTGAEMSRELGLSNSTYSQWNTRKTSPSKKTIPQIAEYLGVTPEYLLTGENGQKNTATMNSDGNSPSDIELLNAFKSSDEATQELIRRVLGLQ